MPEILAPSAGPVWLRKDLLAGGHSDRDLARLVRAGMLRRIRRGAYVDAHAYDAADLDARFRLLGRAVVMQAKTRVILSHASAVPFHDGPTWGMPLDLVDVTRPDGR